MTLPGSRGGSSGPQGAELGFKSRTPTRDERPGPAWGRSVRPQDREKDPLAPEAGDRERQSPQSLRERKIATLSSEPWASVCDLQCDGDIPVGKKGLLQNGENAKTETPPTRGPSPGLHGSLSGISGLALGVRGSPASESPGSLGRLTPPLSRSGPIGGVRSRPPSPRSWNPACAAPGQVPGTPNGAIRLQTYLPSSRGRSEHMSSSGEEAPEASLSD